MNFLTLLRKITLISINSGKKSPWKVKTILNIGADYGKMLQSLTCAICFNLVSLELTNSCKVWLMGCTTILMYSVTIGRLSLSLLTTCLLVKLFISGLSRLAHRKSSSEVEKNRDIMAGQCDWLQEVHSCEKTSAFGGNTNTECSRNLWNWIQLGSSSIWLLMGWNATMSVWEWFARRLEHSEHIGWIFTLWEAGCLC